MPAEVIDKWLESGRYAQVNGARLRPIEHNIFKGTPLSIQRGQAEAFCLNCDNGENYILKKFHKGKRLDYNYLVSAGSLLPKDAGFIAGTERRILSPKTLIMTPGCYYRQDLAAWLDETILMLRVAGIDWATLADEIRQGRLQLHREHRIELARNLTSLIRALEKHNCCHRDISSGNVFIETKSWNIYLIDFDSLYHPSLSMPEATTCGTIGYTPSFAWKSNTLNVRRTWCPYADRYALTIINVEFLALNKGAPLTAEGGMFEQHELRARSGKGIYMIKKLLQKEWQEVVSLFEATINSKNFASCPSPEDWQEVLEAIPGAPVRPPRLEQLENIPQDYFKNVLSKLRPAAPLWPAPNLSSMPTIDFQIPQTNSEYVSLPPDPWNNEKNSMERFE